MNDQAAQFYQQINESIDNGSFIKLSLGNYKGIEADLKKIYIKKILLKSGENLSFVYRYQTRDITKNFPSHEALSKIMQEIENGFNSAMLYTGAFDLSLEVKKDKVFINKIKPSLLENVSLQHDKSKNRMITPEDKSYLYDLKITDEKGNVFKNAQDKYRQINRYIELLDPLIKKLSKEDIKVVDMGAGKGYLTFALYDYLSNVLKKNAKVVGVEYRQDMVDLCNRIARTANFTGLSFIKSDIASYENNDIDILIALHACDTATDDAIYKGIMASSELIVVAPCCHKQIRRELEQSQKKNDLFFMTDYGIFMERQAEMATDGLRALLLNHTGYETKIVEFISSEHTAKNIMIIAHKSDLSEKKRNDALASFREAKKFFGIGSHYLESLLKV
ncbi:MAG: SAM-dependent methyltransferase [Micavibrio aeruginosavorus]|uniref:SAM-dependent methyltransferase n=1 Tax=Micavibrio aeruginosavorus TaxID=349221 RepID=A0A2W5FKX7_9BACT|nr:MAG: SAM-dependent methyltransferase [Micavibrio aeruginosavorus]